MWNLLIPSKYSGSGTLEKRGVGCCLNGVLVKSLPLYLMANSTKVDGMKGSILEYSGLIIEVESMFSSWFCNASEKKILGW